MTLFDPGPAGAGPEPAPVVPAPGRTVRLRLDVAYDGAGFHGFAAQPGLATVGGVLGEALGTVLGHRVELTCAGRTDRGVHARGQVVHVDVSPNVDPARLVRSVNAMLGPAVVLTSATQVAGDFDARRSARARRYRYLVFESDVPDPLLASIAWTVRGPLDLRPMRAAADALLGEHDFRAFCRRVPGSSPDAPIPRRVLGCRWSEVPTSVEALGQSGDFGERGGLGGPGLAGGLGRLWRFDISANAFCHQMVRSIVGMLVEVGRGRRRASDVHWLLTIGDRSQAPDLAPPHGLCLVGVQY